MVGAGSRAEQWWQRGWRWQQQGLEARLVLRIGGRRWRQRAAERRGQGKARV